ncbi:MAG: HAD family hydrolase [Streptosporangiaceae bacterium]
MADTQPADTELADAELAEAGLVEAGLAEVELVTGSAGEGAAALQAVMFDMDGLLVDSEPLWFQAEGTVMARLGGSWVPADQHMLVGGSMPSTVKYLLSKGTRTAKPAAVAGWLMEAMVGLITSGPLPALPGALELVAEVAAAGLPYALVTSSEAAVMDAVLSQLGVLFPVTVCAADVAHAKPDPEGYLLAAAKLGADPRRCIALEDSPNGVAAAEAAGYRTVAVPSVVPVPDRPGRVVLETLAGMTLTGLVELTGLGLGAVL